MKQGDQIPELRKNKLMFYSEYNFLRKISKELLLENEISALFKQEVNQVLIQSGGQDYVFFVTYLKWDSEFFSTQTYRLENVIYSDPDYNKLCDAIKSFQKSFFKEDDYCFINIPPEDTQLIQALGECGFRLIETRLNYFNNQLTQFDFKRFQVREATKNDIDNLKEIASNNRNDFDRFHADEYFSDEVADNYLSTYIEASINGFTDYVMVPNQEGLPSNGFLTANYQKDKWANLNNKVSKMVLSAVDPTCKGWYVKLISEMTYHLKEQGADCIIMNTQATNRAVIKTWEKLNYQLGSTTHVLAYKP